MNEESHVLEIDIGEIDVRWHKPILITGANFEEPMRREIPLLVKQ
jgi:hypothetical protein